MAYTIKLNIDGTDLLDPNTFDVTEAVQFETLTKMNGDDIILERKGNNYIKASISISWNGIPRDYANIIAEILASNTLHTISRGGDAWNNLKLTDFSKSLIDDLRDQAKKDIFYYNVSANFVQITSELLSR